MKKRVISLLLVLVTLLGILATASFAASSEVEALGEMNIYNGNRLMSYLSINVSARTQDYTYYNFITSAGYVRETPAYCVKPNLYGVPQTVGPGQSAADQESAQRVLAAAKTIYQRGTTHNYML